MIYFAEKGEAVKRNRKSYLLILAMTLLVACSGGGAVVYLTLRIPLALSAQLETVSSNLGSGEFKVPIQFNMDSGSGIFDMVDNFFTFLNDAQIPEDSTQVAVTTDQGELKADFSSIGTVTADINMDGTPEEITCSRTTALPICARFWIDDTPLAFLVLVSSSTDEGAVGEGLLSFVPSLVGLVATATEVSTTWTSTAVRDEVRAYYVGQPSDDVVATKAEIVLMRDRSQDDATLKVWQSGVWTQNPIGGCTESQSIFGWVDGSGFISARFENTASCTLPVGSGPCVNVSTAATAALPDDCAVNIIGDTFIPLTSFDAADAQLPGDFPPTPPF